MPRPEHDFPSRTYLIHADLGNATGAFAQDEALVLEPQTIYRLVLGADPMQPQPMAHAEVDQLLRDPFAELLLKRATFPLTLRALLAAFDTFNDSQEGLPTQASYVVADGGQIPWSPETDVLNRQFRFAVTRARGNNVEVLISASWDLDSETQFLQLLAWDPHNQVYNYYQRQAGSWIWGGNSYHALDPGTRGQGPFDSHVNGSLVMKELKAPWSHWHSMRAGIDDNVLAPNDPLRSEPLWKNKAGAEIFERAVVRPGINRWTRSRLTRSVDAAGHMTDVPFFMRQVLETTTVNLVSADIESALVQDDTTFVLPISFFFNTDALLTAIGLNANITPIRARGLWYRNSLKQYDFRLTNGTFSQEGDTFFAFLVPEPAHEDLDVLVALLKQQLLTPHFAASLLMVDFPNPIFSLPRKQLMQYVPEQAQLQQQGGDIMSLFVKAIEAVEQQLAADSPEHEFLANWRLSETTWRTVFEHRIEDYFQALASQVATEVGFDGFMRLAEARRRQLRRHPIAEFRLTLPTTNIPERAPLLAMGKDGTVGIA